jgi:hypothetical protein
VGEVEDHLLTVSAPNQDFGDFSGFPEATSIARSDLRMGASSDAEAILVANVDANSDDANGADDEDGVVQSALRANQDGTITVTVTNLTGAPAISMSGRTGTRITPSIPASRSLRICRWRRD